MVRRRDEHCVEVVVFEDAAEILCAFRLSFLLRGDSRHRAIDSLLIDIAKMRNFHVRNFQEGFHVLQPAIEANDADEQSVSR